MQQVSAAPRVTKLSVLELKIVMIVVEFWVLSASKESVIPVALEMQSVSPMKSAMMAVSACHAALLTSNATPPRSARRMFATLCATVMRTVSSRRTRNPSVAPTTYVLPKRLVMLAVIFGSTDVESATVTMV